VLIGARFVSAKELLGKEPFTGKGDRVGYLIRATYQLPETKSNQPPTIKATWVTNRGNTIKVESLKIGLISDT
jgi:hypothetical protein